MTKNYYGVLMIPPHLLAGYRCSCCALILYERRTLEEERERVVHILSWFIIGLKIARIILMSSLRFRISRITETLFVGSKNRRGTWNLQSLMYEYRFFRETRHDRFSRTFPRLQIMEATLCRPSTSLSRSMTGHKDLKAA